MNKAAMTGIRGLILLTLLSILGCESDSDIQIIRAVSLIPTQSYYTKDFRKWLDEVNKRGEGLFKIIYVGGPEAVATFEQADAARTGVVHMVFGPATYYLGIIPEVEALFASNLPPWITRENGGVELMDKIHQDRLSVRYLARAAFIEFHLYTHEQPRLQVNGMPDLQNLQIRGGPVWRDFITSLGAIFVNIAAPDVYTALERGTINGIGWPIVGLQDASWDKHLGFRIDPGVFSSDLSIIFNAVKWEKLSVPAREIIENAAIEYETNSYHRFKNLTQKLDRQVREGGMQVINLEEEKAERYRALAFDIIWQRLKKRTPGYYDELRSKFYAEQVEESL